MGVTFEQRQLQKAGELRWLLSALALSVAFGGCSPNPSADDIAEKDGGGGSSTVAPDQVTTEDGTLVDCASLQRPPTPLRRLTQFEYNNTVQDLLGTALTPSDAFPADEVTDGFTNNAVLLTVSSLHAEKYMEAAELLSAEAVSNIGMLLPCDPNALGEEACARAFADSFGRKAFRRVLEQGDVDTLMEAYGTGLSFVNGIEIMLRTILQSPHFLFRVEFTGADEAPQAMVRLDPYETATRLSYLMWSSGPDDALLDAAANGQLETAEQVGTMARAMLEDPRARRAAVEFYRQWLELNRLDTTSKDAAAFPLWSNLLRAAIEAESRAYIEHVLFEREGSLAELLTLPLGLPMGPLAQLYGVAEGTTLTELSADERIGILTQPAFLSVQAHPDQTAPVLRGKFIRKKLLCTDVPPPPDDVDLSPPEIHEGATARERFSAHADDSGCRGCHQLMDPLGFPFESYDAIGAFRTMDAGQALDLSGEFVQTRGIDGPFVGAKEMLLTLAEADEVRDCVTRQWFKFAMGRTEEDGDACSLSPLQNGFEESGGNLVELLVQTTQAESFLYRRGSAGGQ